MNRILIGCIAAIGVVGCYMLLRPEPRCTAYTPVSNPLVAHAGGGLPDGVYANNRRAMDLAVKHGFRFIELDFVVIDGRIELGHDEDSLSGTSIATLGAWLKRYPDVSIITDMKSGNEYLPLLVRALGTKQLIPQIYDMSQYAAVKKLGFDRIIFTAYRQADDSWRKNINAFDLWAVTMPAEKRALAKGIRHPVYLHTVNEPLAGNFGLYTDCLIPAR